MSAHGSFETTTGPLAWGALAAAVEDAVSPAAAVGVGVAVLVGVFDVHATAVSVATNTSAILKPVVERIL